MIVHTPPRSVLPVYLKDFWTIAGIDDTVIKTTKVNKML